MELWSISNKNAIQIRKLKLESDSIKLSNPSLTVLIIIIQNVKVQVSAIDRGTCSQRGNIEEKRKKFKIIK